ncbi:MAG: hypothetical protein BHV82_02375 [Odoribacter sp. 43_10]|nr:MAG: hypothetical protein BHV82_02375 [Odoribacter sp. 43_10]
MFEMNPNVQTVLYNGMIHPLAPYKFRGVIWYQGENNALAMGADFLMMGRYFARFDESPSKKLAIGNSYVKEYWGEGSNRAQNWQRYDMGGNSKAALKFEEGVDSYVPYAGKMKDNLEITLGKIKSTMCSCGSVTIPQLQERAKITLVSSTSIVEGGAHDVILKDTKIQ